MIKVQYEGDICILTLSRPHRANALTLTMLERLVDELVFASLNAKVLVLTGEGAVFSAGADLQEIKTTDLATNPIWEKISVGIADMPLFTIAALNGPVVGGACGMVLACDLRIATPTTEVFYPVMRNGILPQPSDPKRLSALVGPARAKLVFMAGQKLSAEECLTFGLVEKIVKPEVLLDTAREWSADILAAPQLIAENIKLTFSEDDV